uniref:NOI-like protein n=1 Tax=Elaeis oleifera TaxID=80265 RepID=NOIL_ELAOL|nr:RecName: Full=NOI-like protein [Elaeis oleifera]AAL87238.1 nitrate-induced NOI-like protein [Elaeis oleifera]
MAQPAHVPKFGNWDGENISYTTYFETVHRDKGDGSKIFNPNDPEENPQAFYPRTVAQDHQHSEKHHNDTSTDYHVVKQHRRKHHRREDREFHRYVEAPRPHRSPFQGVDMDSHRSRNHGTSATMSSSVKRNSDNWLPQHQHHRRTNKDLAEGKSWLFTTTTASSYTKSRKLSRECSSTTQSSISAKNLVPGDETRSPISWRVFQSYLTKLKEQKQIAATKIGQHLNLR